MLLRSVFKETARIGTAGWREATRHLCMAVDFGEGVGGGWGMLGSDVEQYLERKHCS